MIFAQRAQHPFDRIARVPPTQSASPASDHNPSARSSPDKCRNRPGPRSRRFRKLHDHVRAKERNYSSRIFGVYAALDRGAAQLNLLLREGHRSPAAISICSRTRSRPVTSSVTGCSTCSRVFISRSRMPPPVGQEFDRAGIVITSGARRANGGFPHARRASRDASRPAAKGDSSITF